MAKAERCPRCGELATEISRRAEVSICEKCGVAEALEDSFGKDKMSLKEWAAAKEL